MQQCLGCFRRGTFTNYAMYYSLNEILIETKTFNNGSLGSCIDEERSELR